MNDSEDAFGHAILDYFHGKHVEEAGRFGCHTWFSEYEKWFEREKNAIRYAKGRVLDVGCGAGRHSLYLQELGHDVLAVDNSPLAVRVCRKRGVKNAEVMAVTQLSHRLGVFDTILMLGNNFGLVANCKRGQWLFRKFKRMTPSDGIVIAGDGFFDMEAASATVRKQVARNLREGRMPGEFRFRKRYRRYLSPPIRWLYASKDHMRHVLDGTGWRVDQFIEDDTGAFVGIIKKAGPA